ncbi:MAG: T9SS type A sorting domain-containing protein, partial [Bacteroidota bacterium]
VHSQWRHAIDDIELDGQGNIYYSGGAGGAWNIPQPLSIAKTNAQNEGLCNLREVAVITSPLTVTWDGNMLPPMTSFSGGTTTVPAESPLPAQHRRCSVKSFQKNGTELTLEHTVDISPNPATDHLRLEGAGMEHLLQATVLDITGRTLAQYGKGQVHSLPVHDLPAGSYFLRLQFEDGHQETERFVKQ